MEAQSLEDAFRQICAMEFPCMSAWRPSRRPYASSDCPLPKPTTISSRGSARAMREARRRARRPDALVPAAGQLRAAPGPCGSARRRAGRDQLQSGALVRVLRHRADGLPAGAQRDCRAWGERRLDHAGDRGVHREGGGKHQQRLQDPVRHRQQLRAQPWPRYLARRARAHALPSRLTSSATRPRPHGSFPSRRRSSSAATGASLRATSIPIFAIAWTSRTLSRSKSAR